MKEDAKPWWFWVLLAFTVLLLIPIWYFQFLPLNDWPNHLAGVALVLENDAGRPSYLQANPNPFLPNSTDFWFMRLLGPLVGVEASGRLLLSLTVILSIWGAAYFMRQIHPDLEPLGGAMGAALAYNWFFLMGFLNYALCIPLFLVAAGYWIGKKESGTSNSKTIATAIALSLLATLTHLVAGGVLVAVIGAIRLIKALQAAWKSKSAKNGLRHLFKNIRWDLALVLPVLAIALLSLGPILAPEQGGRMVWGNPLQELNYLLHTPPNPALSIIFLVIVTTDIVIWIRSGGKGFRPDAGWLAAAVLLAAGAMLLPESTASWQFAAPRLWPFFIFALAAAVFKPLAERGAKQLIAELTIALFIFTLAEMGVMMAGWAAEQPRLEAIASVAEHLQPAAGADRQAGWTGDGPDIAVLPIGEGFAMTGGQSGVSPYFHAWGYWVVQKGVYVPYVFAEMYSPVQYKEPAARARADLTGAIGDLAFKMFAKPTAEKCKYWKEYYQTLNWTQIGEEYDYVVLRTGACENAAIVPAPFEQKWTNGPLYVFENKNRKK